VSDLDPHGDALLLFGVELLAQECVEESEVARLLASSVGEDGVEACGDGAEAQSHKVILDASANEVGHGAPPTAAA
jgi:hypothetical protein